MEKQVLSKVQKLSGYIGDFIRYWGFRRIHGQIWSVVYLSEKPLSGAEIVKILKVSKALVSPALKELEQEGLLLSAPSENSKTKRYQAEEDVEKIIKNVLKRRERPMIQKIQQSYQDLNDSCSGEKGINSLRLAKMGMMVQMARMGLSALSESDSLWNVDVGL